MKVIRLMYHSGCVDCDHSIQKTYIFYMYFEVYRANICIWKLIWELHSELIYSGNIVWMTRLRQEMNTLIG